MFNLNNCGVHKKVQYFSQFKHKIIIFEKLLGAAYTTH